LGAGPACFDPAAPRGARVKRAEQFERGRRPTPRSEPGAAAERTEPEPTEDAEKPSDVKGTGQKGNGGNGDGATATAAGTATAAKGMDGLRRVR
jgi:hypothetical protein